MNIACPSCHHPNPGDALFCGQCGTALRTESPCTTCGRANPVDLTFCRSCGARLGAPSTSALTEASAATPTFLAAGRYRLERMLGEGSKKRVYLAHDTRLDRAVAVALFKTDRLDRAGQLRIQREAQALARLGDHPHIVTLYDIGEETGQSYFVSQYMAGGTLQEWVQRNATQHLSLEDALRVIDQLCQALMHAHQHGVLHRDLKPSNVWLTIDGTVKLGDFGLAASLEQSRLTLEGILMGTAAYLPPEQLQGSKATVRSDLYSLGAIFYELVTGRPPFVGDNLVSIIAQHLNTPPVAPVQFNAATSPALNTLILQLLAKQPDERPESASAVHIALQALITVATATGSSSLVTPALDRLARDVFVGREREMDVLRSKLEEALAGQGRTVVLLGEPGIGKTRLAAELTPYAQVRGMRVLIGRCPESDGAPPYWPWMQLVRTYVSKSDPQQIRTDMGVGAADLAQVIPAVREQLSDLAPSPRLEPAQERFRFFDSLTTFLKNVAKRQPSLLVLDDLQWADAPSLLFLQFLVRELTNTKLFLVITCRESEVTQQPLLTQTLAAIARASGSQTLRLRGLSGTDVAKFMELTTGHATSDDISAAVFRRTEGHPFFLTEVVRLLASEQTAGTHERSQTSPLLLPPTVRSVIEQRLQTVSPACRRLLTVAAAIGREFRLHVLETVANQWEQPLAVSTPSEEEGREENTPSVLQLLDEALAARLLVPVPQNVGRYSFTHALIQETLYEGISTTDRLRLHRWIGDALEKMAGDYAAPFLSELAHHFFQAAQSGDVIDKAISYAISAAEGATAVLAYEEATAHYERALALLPFKEPDEELRCTLLLALGKAQERASDFTAAKQQFQQAAELAKTRRLANQLAHAALGLAGTRIPVSGANPVILQILQEALALLPQDAHALRAQLLARLAKELTYSDDHEQREQYSYEAVTLARAATDLSALGSALCDHCIATWRPDTLPERLALSAEISALAEQVGDPELVLYSHFLRIANALEQDDLLTIDAEIAGFARHVAEIRPPMYTWMWFYERIQTMRAILTGRFAEAEEQLLHPSTSLHHTPSSRDAEPMVFPQFLVLRREQGRLQEPGLEALLKHAAEQYPALSALRCALAYVHSELGREAEARVEFEYWAKHNFLTVPQRQDRLVTFAYLVEICTAWSDAPRALQLYNLLLPYAKRNIVVGTVLGYFDTAAHLLGKLATVLGRYEEAQAHFEVALQRNLSLSARPRLAHTQYSYACMLLTRNQPGDQERATTFLGQALATAQELGMEGLEDKVKIQRAKIKSQNEQETKDRGLETSHSSSQVANRKPQVSRFRRDGEYWTVSFQNAECRLKDSRGLHYLSQLLLHPHHEFSALDLVNLGAGPSDMPNPQRTADLLAAHASVTTGGDAGESLDPHATTAYQQRLKELREELEEAKEFNDLGRIEKLEEESEFLLRELSRAVGLGGRRRKASSAAERARLNVTVTLKSTIARITKHHRALGQHLSQTIKTGTFCSYTPSPALAVEWQVE